MKRNVSTSTQAVVSDASNASASEEATAEDAPQVNLSPTTALPPPISESQANHEYEQIMFKMSSPIYHQLC